MKSERGQSLVELAISFVVLMYLLSGAVEFGLAFFQFVQLRDAVQEGALYGSMMPDDTAGIINRTRSSSPSPIDLTALTPVISYDGPHCEGNSITVELTYNHQIFMPFLPALIGQGTLPLRAVVTDTILTPRCP